MRSSAGSQCLSLCAAGGAQARASAGLQWQPCHCPIQQRLRMQQQWLGPSAAALELLEIHTGSIPDSLTPRARARVHSRCSLLRSCSRGVREGHVLYSEDLLYCNACIVRAGVCRRPRPWHRSPVLRFRRAALRLALLYRVAGSGGRILTNGGLTDDPAHSGTAAAATPQARAQARAAARSGTPHARASSAALHAWRVGVCAVRLAAWPRMCQDPETHQCGVQSLEAGASCCSLGAKQALRRGL